MLPFVYTIPYTTHYKPPELKEKTISFAVSFLSKLSPWSIQVHYVHKGAGRQQAQADFFSIKLIAWKYSADLAKQG